MINQKWGRIIHFSSIVANEGAKGAGVYAASKSAVNNLTKLLKNNLFLKKEGKSFEKDRMKDMKR